MAFYLLGSKEIWTNKADEQIREEYNMKINKFEDKLQLNLQFFSDDPEGTPGNPGETPSADDKTEGETKTFNQEDVNDIVAKRLAREKVKYEEEFKAKLASEKKEAERLAKLSEAEREKAITDKAKAEFEAERSAFQLEKIELEVTKQLAEKNLPISFAKMLVTDDADTSLKNIKKFEKDWQDALSKAVDEKVKGTSPRGGSTTVGNTTADIMKLAKEASIRK